MKKSIVWIRRETVAIWQQVTAWIALHLAALGWIGLAIAFIATLVILYLKWKAFHDFVDKNWWWLMFINPVLYALISFKKLIDIINKLREILRNPIKAVIDFTINFPDIAKKAPWWAKVAAGVVLLPVSAAPLAGYGAYKGYKALKGAEGGIVPYASRVLVGERGPEVLTLPMGSRIQPLPQSGGAAALSMPEFPRVINLKTVLNVDGRQLAEVDSKHRLDRRARR